MGMMGAIVTNTTQQEWQSEFSTTLRKLLAIAQSGKIDNSVQVELGTVVSWNDQYAIGETTRRPA